MPNVDIKKGENSHFFGELTIKASPPICFKIIILLNLSLDRSVLMLFVCLSVCVFPLLATGIKRAGDFWSNNILQNLNIKTKQKMEVFNKFLGFDISRVVLDFVLVNQPNK